MSDSSECGLAVVQCPHGDPTCPCPDEDACHYEGGDAMICPNPVLGIVGLVYAHCHMEGCSWHVRDCAGRISGECGLVKLGLPPLDVGEMQMYSMTQARPGLPGWPCGWLRTPLNLASGEQHDGSAEILIREVGDSDGER